MTSPRKKSARSERDEGRRSPRRSPEKRIVVRERQHGCTRQHKQKKPRYRQSPSGHEAQRRYQQSPAGREAQRRYRQSPLGLECQRRYRQSPKGLERQLRYRRSPKGVESQWQYEGRRNQAPARQQYKRERARQYRQTAIYKERQLDRHFRRADALYRELVSPGLNDPRRVEQFHRLQDFLVRREAQIRGDWQPAPSTIRARAARERQRERLLDLPPREPPLASPRRGKWRTWS
jgi:hypothetical protein